MAGWFSQWLVDSAIGWLIHMGGHSIWAYVRCLVREKILVEKDVLDHPTIGCMLYKWYMYQVPLFSLGVRWVPREPVCCGEPSRWVDVGLVHTWWWMVKESEQMIDHQKPTWKWMNMMLSKIGSLPIQGRIIFYTYTGNLFELQYFTNFQIPWRRYFVLPKLNCFNWKIQNTWSEKWRFFSGVW